MCIEIVTLQSVIITGGGFETASVYADFCRRVQLLPAHAIAVSVCAFGAAV